MIFKYYEIPSIDEVKSHIQSYTVIFCEVEILYVKSENSVGFRKGFIFKTTEELPFPKRLFISNKSVIVDNKESFVYPSSYLFIDPEHLQITERASDVIITINQYYSVWTNGCDSKYFSFYTEAREYFRSLKCKAMFFFSPNGGASIKLDEYWPEGVYLKIHHASAENHEINYVGSFGITTKENAKKVYYFSEIYRAIEVEKI